MGFAGIKQVRLTHKGTRSFLSDTAGQDAVNGIHDHSNYKSLVGMGEVEAVMNGVEFRTRHNDFELRMPSKANQNYHATEKIPFPAVPPSVLSKHTVAEQITEMQNYFKAWKYQDHRLKDYRPYFKAVLCYMEAAWTKDTKTAKDEFPNDRHTMVSEDWSDIEQKNRFYAYAGGRDLSENLVFLPRTIMNVKNGTVEYSQWNYRILCHPLNKDVPLKVFEPIDDLATRLSKKYDIRQIAKTKAARFNLATYERHGHYDPDLGYGWINDVAYSSSLLDDYMMQIPGKNNYPGNLIEDTFGMKMFHPTIRGKVLNTGYYHRRYKYDRAGAMGTTTANRGYTDAHMWAAQTNSDHISNIEITDCQKVNNKRVCKQYHPKYSYAIPLEIIYMTPLLSWNPYNLNFHGDARGDAYVTAGGRHGGFNASTAFTGISEKNFYMTPKEFFGEIGHPVYKEAEESAVGVLDHHHNVQKVLPSGTRVFLPSIPGVGRLRTRYPIAPLFREGSSVYKELDALKELVNFIDSHSSLLQDPPSLVGKVPQLQPDAHFRTTLATKDPPGRHYHELFIEHADYERALRHEKITVETTQESSHTHMVEITYDSHSHHWVITQCDGEQHCWDGHSNMLTKID